MQLRELMTHSVITAPRHDARFRTGSLEAAKGMTADVIEGTLPGLYFFERG